MSRVYFQGPDAVVTDRYFVRRAAPSRTYAVAELRDTGIARRKQARPTAYHITVAAGGLAVVALGVLIARRLQTTSGVSGTAAGVLLVIAGVGRSLWVRRRIWELRATYRGTKVLLYATGDDAGFHQVARALRRAIEDARPRPARTGPEDTGDGDGGDGT